MKRPILCNKSLLDRVIILEVRRANAPWHAFCVDRMRVSRMLAKVFEAAESDDVKRMLAKRKARDERFAAWRRLANCVKQVSCRIRTRPRAPEGAGGSKCLRQVTAGTWFSAIWAGGQGLTS